MNFWTNCVRLAAFWKNKATVKRIGNRLERIPMMKKRILAVLLVILVLAMAGCGRKKVEETTPMTDPVTTVESTVAETKDIPLEDNIFDDDPEETTEATEATEETESQDQNSDSSVEPTEAAQPTDPKPTTPKPTEPTKPTKPTETTDPTEGTKPAEDESSDGNLTEYEQFQNMSPEQQQAYMESFESIEAFFEWLNEAKEAYEKANPPIEVGSGTIDIGAIIEGKN